MTDSPSSIQAAINAGIAMSDPIEIGEARSFVLLPTGVTVHDLEGLLPTPTRKRGAPTFRDIRSFMRFVNEHKLPQTRIYYSTDLDKLSFTSVFNEHCPVQEADTEPATAGWRDFKAIYNCPFSTEWKTWIRQNNTTMTQAAFALFIENNLPDIREPAAADMLEISRTLEAKKKVTFSSGIRLSDGQNDLTYSEEITGSTKNGKLQIPETVLIAIPVFEGGPLYRITARLRYRIDNGSLSIWFDLLRSHKSVDHALAEMVQTIEVGLPEIKDDSNKVTQEALTGTGIKPFNGNP